MLGHKVSEDQGQAWPLEGGLHSENHGWAGQQEGCLGHDHLQDCHLQRAMGERRPHVEFQGQTLLIWGSRAGIGIL